MLPQAMIWTESTCHVPTGGAVEENKRFASRERNWHLGVLCFLLSPKSADESSGVVCKIRKHSQLDIIEAVSCLPIVVLVLISTLKGRTIELPTVGLVLKDTQVYTAMAESLDGRIAGLGCGRCFCVGSWHGWLWERNKKGRMISTSCRRRNYSMLRSRRQCGEILDRVHPVRCGKWKECVFAKLMGDG